MGRTHSNADVKQKDHILWGLQEIVTCR